MRFSVATIRTDSTSPCPQPSIEEGKQLFDFHHKRTTMTFGSWNILFTKNQMIGRKLTFFFSKKLVSFTPIFQLQNLSLLAYSKLTIWCLHSSGRLRHRTLSVNLWIFVQKIYKEKYWNDVDNLVSMEHLYFQVALEQTARLLETFTSTSFFKGSLRAEKAFGRVFDPTAA